ncbi:hypothetical protein GCM10023317_22480 [Actinopolymorpha pittospori]
MVRSSYAPQFGLLLGRQLGLLPRAQSALRPRDGHALPSPHSQQVDLDYMDSFKIATV